MKTCCTREIWEIERKGEPLALVRGTPHAEQTWLAEKIGLSDTQKKDWLQKGVAPGEYYIPNTFWMFWGGDAGRLGRWWISWNTNRKLLQRLGFHVREIQVHDSQQILHALEKSTREKTCHGLFLWSHGSSEFLFGRKNLLGKEGIPLWQLDFEEVASVLSYRLGAVILNACHAAEGGQKWVSESPGSIFAATQLVLNPLPWISTSGIREFVQWLSGREIPHPDLCVPPFSLRSLFSHGEQGTQRVS